MCLSGVVLFCCLSLSITFHSVCFLGFFHVSVSHPARQGYVNVNMFAAKHRLRRSLPASAHYCVHTSETRAEAAHDLAFFFGKDMDAIRLDFESPVIPPSKDACALPSVVPMVHSGERPVLTPLLPESKKTLPPASLHDVRCETLLSPHPCRLFNRCVSVCVWVCVHGYVF